MGFDIPTPDEPDFEGSGSGFPLTSDADFAGFKGTGAGSPNDPGDLTNKDYVDGAVLTLEDTLENDYSTTTESDAAYSPIAYATFVRKVRQTLTDKTSWAGTSDEQWGSEEATFDNALLPKTTGVTVEALVIGSVLNNSNSNSLVVRVDLSLDGGATWDITGMPTVIRVNPAEATQSRYPIMAAHAVTGTVTGDIMARVMGSQGVGAAFPQDLTQGVIYMTVEVHP